MVSVDYAYSSRRDRLAFTMLELVFAIVIIGISILALPTVLFSTAASQEQTLKEEGILITTTKIAQILTYPWDPQSSPLGALMSTSQVLNTTNGDAELGRSGASDFRQGHFPDELRRRMTPASSQRNASVIPVAPVIPASSISDFNAEQLTVGFANAARGYKKQYRTTTTVSYIDDTAADYNTTANTNIAYNFLTVGYAGAQTSNIKMVEVATDESDGAGGWTPIIVMRSYGSNIGEAEFFKRRY